MTNKAGSTTFAAGIAVAALIAGTFIGMKLGGTSEEEVVTYGTLPPKPAAAPAAPAAAVEAAALQMPDADPASLGDRYFESGRFPEAITYYRKALEADPRDADTLNDLGLALFYSGRKEEGLVEVRKAVETAPAFQPARLSLGFILTSLERFPEANEALKKTIELGPLSPQGQEAKRMLVQNLAASSPKP